MDILNFDPTPSSQPLLTPLLAVFQQLNFRALTPPTSLAPHLYFSGVLPLPRAKQYLNADFKVKIVNNKLVKLQLRLNPQMCSFSRWLLQFFHKRFRELCHFVHLTNHLQLKEREGVFKISEPTGNIAYQTSLSSVFWVSSRAKQEQLLGSHLRRMVNTYSHILENIIFYYRIPGFNLNELQLMLQEQNAVQLKVVTEKIMLLKAYFDNDSNEAMYNYERQIGQAQYLMRGSSPFESRIPPQKRKKEHSFKIESQFKYQQEILIKNLEQFQKQKSDSILTSIEITQKTMEHPITKGGYAYITYGLYDFVPLFSVHEQINYELAQMQDLECKKQKSTPSKTGCCLVKKASLNRDQVGGALKNQCSFLTYMKSKICPYFAKYYCNKSIIPFADGHIYLQYYPASLDQTQLRYEGKLKVLEDVCMGLLFLSKQEILHRDLKELNIMVDRSKRGRVIDFGSVAPFFRSDKFRVQDTRLRSTEGYYYPYRNLLNFHPRLTMLYSKEEYYRHPNFDIYSLGRIIYNEFSLEMIYEEGDFLRHFLYYLSLRCLEVQPTKRWPILKVLCFLRQLLLYLEQQNKFWKYGFEKHCRAHMLGSTFVTKEFSNEQRLAEQHPKMN